MKKRDYISHVVASINDIEMPIEQVKCLIIAGVIPIQYQYKDDDIKATQEGDCIIIPRYKYDNLGETFNYDYYHMVYITKALANANFRSQAFSEEMKKYMQKIMIMDTSDKKFNWKDFFKEIVRAGLIIYTDLPRENEDDDKQSYFYLKKPSKKQMNNISELLDKLELANYECGVDILTYNKNMEEEWESIIDKKPKELKKILLERFLSDVNQTIEDNTQLY